MSASPTWDPAHVKAQLRFAAQRLGQLQDRKDSLAHITSRDIATLLSQRNVSLARTKAQNLMKDDALSNAMEVLEMYCGLVLERFSELDDFRLHPSTVEAVASIIYAAGFTECQELVIVRGTLAERLGPEFAQSTLHNSDGHVSQRILRLVHSAPSADDIDAYLWNIARKFNVDWKPQMKMDEKLAILSEMLDASDTLGTVNLERLREIAFSSVPMDPSWLRPRVWKLLLGTTPLLKVQWESESQRKRNDYYDLIRRLLVNVPSLPRPTSPPSPADKALLALVESLSRVPAHLFRGLEDEVEQSTSCPVHDAASPDVKIDFAFALDARLHLIQDQSSKGDEGSSINATPEIRLDSGSTPSSPQEAIFDLSEAAQGGAPQSPARMLSSSVTLAPKAFRSIPAHPSHVSALLRLLYTHKSLNPGSESPYLASLLLPVYTVMNQEADPAELAHAEADTFWTFEVLIREVSELDETDGGVVWMKKLRERLAISDNELLEDLVLKGLDPGLPQYSYRWLAPVLSHTLPLPSVLMAWDSIFAEPEMSRQSNPRLEHLLNICTAMLVRARARLLLLGKGRRSPSLWDVDPSGVERQALRPWELGDAFMEGMTLLQNYPIKEAGGMERVLQVAGDIYLQKQQLEKPPQTQGTGLATIIRDRMWRGITNQSTEDSNSPEDSDEDSGDETETESERMQTKSNAQAAPTASGWGYYFKSTVVRGITNESAMDPDSPATSPLPSPIPSPRRASREASPSPLSPAQADLDKPSAHLTVPSTSSFWGYAEKLRQSDMAAKLSKASTNLSAKALDAWTARNASIYEATTVPDKRHKSSDSVPVTDGRIVESPDNGFRRGSLPSISQSNTYSPPPRPAFFKPPRDTRMFSQEELDSLKVLDSPESTHSSLSASTVSAGDRGKLPSTIASVLPSWAGIQPKSPKPVKTAPKPLLLSARSSVLDAGHSIQISRSANSTPVPLNPDWSEVLRNKAIGSPRHRDSQYSQTSSSRTSNNSASPRESRSGWDSDQSISRIVRLNRGSISPMAPAFRVAHTSSRNASISSQSEFGVLSYRAASESSPSAASTKLRDEAPRSTRNSDRVSPDSPATLPSSSPPRTPVTNGGLTQSVRVADAERQRGSLVLSEPGFSSVDATPQSKARKPSVVAAGDTSDSSLPSASPLTRNAARVRTKRFNGGHGRPPSLRIRESTVESDRKNASIFVSNANPSSLAAPELDPELDIATTPRAAQFPSTSPTEARPRSPRSPRHRKISMEDPERRRKLSNEMNGMTRTRKSSNESRTARTRKISNGSYSRRDSVADDGDDEGYDDVLSAYESEDTKYESASSEA